MSVDRHLPQFACADRATAIHEGPAVGLPRKRSNRNPAGHQQLRRSTVLRYYAERVRRAILPAKKREPVAIRGKGGGNILRGIWSFCDRLSGAAGKREPVQTERKCGVQTV